MSSYANSNANVVVSNTSNNDALFMVGFGFGFVVLISIISVVVLYISRRKKYEKQLKNIENIEDVTKRGKAYTNFLKDWNITDTKVINNIVDRLKLDIL